MRLVLVALALAQTLLPKPSTLQQITVEPSTSAATVAKGGVVTLWADVTLKPKIHVYATDKQGFTPISLAVTPQPRISVGKVNYPPAETGLTPGIDMLVPIPMYTKPFRLAAPITIGSSAKAGEALTITGTVTYQACNETLCFPAASLPLTWVVTLK